MRESSTEDETNEKQPKIIELIKTTQQEQMLKQPQSLSHKR